MRRTKLQKLETAANNEFLDLYCSPVIIFRVMTSRRLGDGRDIWDRVEEMCMPNFGGETWRKIYTCKALT